MYMGDWGTTTVVASGGLLLGLTSFRFLNPNVEQPADNLSLWESAHIIENV